MSSTKFTPNASPCGRCGCGTYDALSMTTPLAVRLRGAHPSDRADMIPKCQMYDRDCIGTSDFIYALNLEEARAGGEQL